MSHPEPPSVYKNRQILANREYTNRFFGHRGVQGKHAYARRPCVPHTASNSITTPWLLARSPRREHTRFVFFGGGHVLRPNGTAVLEGASVPALVTTKVARGHPPAEVLNLRITHF